MTDLTAPQSPSLELSSSSVSPECPRKKAESNSWNRLEAREAKITTGKPVQAHRTGRGWAAND